VGAQDQLESEREALSAARKKIERERAEMLAAISRLDAELEGALDEERKARASAELRVQVATLTERTARVEMLHATIEKLK
jgi:predicted ribosome quality control (RQC) complex YloA/Tae2 family protein